MWLSIIGQSSMWIWLLLYAKKAGDCRHSVWNSHLGRVAALRDVWRTVCGVLQNVACFNDPCVHSQHSMPTRVYTTLPLSPNDTSNETSNIKKLCNDDDFNHWQLSIHELAICTHFNSPQTIKRQFFKYILWMPEQSKGNMGLISNYVEIQFFAHGSKLFMIFSLYHGHSPKLFQVGIKQSRILVTAFNFSSRTSRFWTKPCFKA